MIRAAVFVAVSLVFISSARTVENPSEALAVLEQKLNGMWKGNGPCAGELTLKSRGTFERRHFSPGNNNLAGTWELRWDALPPTLVLTCKTSDDSDYLGKTSEVKLIQLDDETLACQYLDEKPVRYTRVKK